MLVRALKVLVINAAILLLLLVPVELVFGNWIRPMSLGDLKRFSIPVGVQYSFDTRPIYAGGPVRATYTRDQYGLRGAATSLDQIRVVTIGGSTTDQRNLDDGQTWQSVTERHLRQLGYPLILTNAGVDGQSTVGHAFSFHNWFPLLDGLRPRLVLFYVGINDVLMTSEREAFDRSVDASSWRSKSVLFQMAKIVRGNLRAQAVGATHGRSLPSEDEFTDQGLLDQPTRDRLAAEVLAGFLRRVDGLREDVRAWGAEPIFVTQTAYGWNADRRPPRGRRAPIRLHGVDANFADVAFVHQHLNRELMAHCASKGITCFDLAAEVAFDAEDYYDPLHNTPSGADKIGRYLAGRLVALDPPLLPRQKGTGARGR